MSSSKIFLFKKPYPLLIIASAPPPTKFPITEDLIFCSPFSCKTKFNASSKSGPLLIIVPSRSKITFKIFIHYLDNLC